MISVDKLDCPVSHVFILICFFPIIQPRCGSAGSDPADEKPGLEMEKWSRKSRSDRAETEKLDGVERGSTSARRNSEVPTCNECRLVTPVVSLGFPWSSKNPGLASLLSKNRTHHDDRLA